MGDSLAFGRGPHMCVGAALGRLELIVATQELLAAAPGFALDGEPTQTRFPEIGALRAPIRFEVAR
jgi:cytochrome P450